MSARAPQAIYNLWYAIHRDLPRSQLGGIVGDVAHSFGYHLARRDLPGSDYSVQLGKDKTGASDCASALDVSLPPDLMKLCTKRLLDAAQAHDPRLAAVREFCGTLDGQHTYPWDLSSNTSEGIDSWDNSHLWHIHLSFYRGLADNAAALLPVHEVFAGVPLKYPPNHPKWSDTVTRDEIVALVDQHIQTVGKDVAHAEVLDGLRATHLGGDHGAFTQKDNGLLVAAPGKGILQRLGAVETAEKAGKS